MVDKRQQFIAAQISAIKTRKHPIRTLDREIGNERELSLRVRANSYRITERLKALRAKKTYQPPRRDDLADRDIFQEIQDSLQHGMTVRLSARSAPSVVRRTYPLHQTELNRIRSEDRRNIKAGKLEKTLWVPPWTRTGGRLKAFAWAMTMHEAGARAMTAHIAPKTIEAAKRDKRGFARHIRERIQRELRTRLMGTAVPMPEFFFVVERSTFGREHLHGAIQCGDDETTIRLIREAIYSGCGFRKAKRSGREVDLRLLFNPARWTAYIAKWHEGTSIDLGDSIFSATSRLRKWSKDFYTYARDNEIAFKQYIGDTLDMHAYLAKGN
jgi:hypothetical protein